MENQEVQVLEKKIAHLESVNDYLVSELESMDGLFKAIGFKFGINSARMAAEEILREVKKEH